MFWWGLAVGVLLGMAGGLVCDRWEDRMLRRYFKDCDKGCD